MPSAVPLPCPPQVDRVQRSVNNQEMRLEAIGIVLRDVEDLLRNQLALVARAAPGNL